MAIDTTQVRSRRSLLIAAFGGAAAALASVVARGTPAVAADTDPLIIGASDNQGSSLTKLTTTAGNAALWAEHTGAEGGGLKGKSVGGVGVGGESGTWIGVAGTSLAHTGVQGQAFATGTALRAIAHQDAIGLDVHTGRIKVGQVSGVDIIPAGALQVTVTPGVDINAETFVLLTPMANIGSRALWFTKNVNAETFTIRMSPARGRNTKVAWLALERG